MCPNFERILKILNDILLFSGRQRCKRPSSEMAGASAVFIMDMKSKVIISSDLFKTFALKLLRSEL